jgi:hypothetical protein
MIDICNHGNYSGATQHQQLWPPLTDTPRPDRSIHISGTRIAAVFYTISAGRFAPFGQDPTLQNNQIQLNKSDLI